MSLLKSLTSFTINNITNSQSIVELNNSNVQNNKFENSLTQSKLNHYNNVHLFGFRINN
ncbi:hypothetical protein DICPUDRAFT_148429 [Dictyostelium purpureum]|uniref:Uncharacterized protein n=1 Tax=Dictyostelium purpureum TaxID=5786 RepID=F0ZB40_DICPU|nr:uncharacterized protein DICPUDRAFT_148429 [Dictyostelium purpureum]EGC38827.1 hypothetical protein DICPUDRAFT_148429 [Dictyostelium purpureum]|eukprot:XP_003284621.1 hypothetical protein DICPUDRAFT_148429 [Dictyostelium purpureum]